jgi:hypothetical protein
LLLQGVVRFQHQATEVQIADVRHMQLPIRPSFAPIADSYISARCFHS